MNLAKVQINCVVVVVVVILLSLITKFNTMSEFMSISFDKNWTKQTRILEVRHLRMDSYWKRKH